MNDSDAERCDNCRYYVSFCNVDRGLCKRYPPKTFTLNEHVYPVVINYDWCGEYQRSNQKENE